MITSVAELLKAVAALAWPIAIYFLFRHFRPFITALMESAKSREFTIEIAGQKLTMKEITDQERLAISDLQLQILHLQEKLGVSGYPGASEKITSGLILWVDDYPRNNGLYIQQLADAGVNTDIATSTAEALEKFHPKKYRAVVSDMGRRERGEDNPKAGLALLREIRAVDRDIPIIFFASRRAVEHTRDAAMKSGATGITSSGTELLRLWASA